jgi:uncharacterized protein (TIGR03067 family)
MHRFVLLLTTAGLAMAFAPAPFPKPDSSQKEIRKLNGSWTRVSMTVGGNMIGGTMDAVIAGNRMKYLRPQGEPIVDWAITVDPRKTPRVFDMKALTGGEKGTTYWGIYRFENDTLTIAGCKGPTESSRPISFTAPIPGLIIEVFKRRK